MKEHKTANGLTKTEMTGMVRNLIANLKVWGGDENLAEAEHLAACMREGFILSALDDYVDFITQGDWHDAYERLKAYEEEIHFIYAKRELDIMDYTD